MSLTRLHQQPNSVRPYAMPMCSCYSRRRRGHRSRDSRQSVQSIQDRFAPGGFFEKLLASIWGDLCVEALVAFEDVKDDGIGSGTVSKLALDPTLSKVGFIDLSRKEFSNSPYLATRRRIWMQVALSGSSLSPDACAASAAVKCIAKTLRRRRETFSLIRERT